MLRKRGRFLSISRGREFAGRGLWIIGRECVAPCHNWLVKFLSCGVDINRCDMEIALVVLADTGLSDGSVLQGPK